MGVLPVNGPVRGIVWGVALRSSLDGLQKKPASMTIFYVSHSCGPLLAETFPIILLYVDLFLRLPHTFARTCCTIHRA